MNYLHNAWFIARKEVKYTICQREMILWLLIMPTVFIYFIGTITGGVSQSVVEPRDPLALQKPADAGFLGDELEQRLRENGFEVKYPEPAAGISNFTRQLVLPENMTAKILAGEGVKARFARIGEGLDEEYDRLRVGRSVYTVLADILACSSMGYPLDSNSFQKLREQPRALALEIKPAGRRQEIPTGYEQAAPGTMILFSLIILITTGTVSTILERKRGLLKRLASSPLAKSEILLGKWLGRLSLALIQVGISYVASAWLFHVKWGPHWPMVWVVLFLWCGFCASIGLVLGQVIQTEGQAVGIGVLSSNVLAALGGCWWPIEITPAFMQLLAKALPTGWAMDALHQLVSFGAPASTVLPHCLALIAASLVLGGLGARWFKYQ